MNFEVMSQKQAVLYTLEHHENKSIIISFRGELDSPVNYLLNKDNNNGVVDALYIVADDASEVGGSIAYFFNKNNNGIMSVGEFEKTGRRIFTEEDANNICDFVTKYKDEVDTIIVHCGAGISRSAGCCGAIMKALTGSDSEIFGSNKYKPNMTVYSKTLEAFAKKGYLGVYGRH